MKRLFPSPLVSCALFVFWLMLDRGPGPALGFGIGQVLLAFIVAIAVPVLIAPLTPPTGPVRRPLVLARLVLRVGMDVVLSGMSVARGVLRSNRRPPRGEFVVIPLDLRQPHALAALAVISAVIPGTVWSELSRDRDVLLMHVFDVGAPEAFVQRFKSRYERPLKEIFE